jgi:Uma2 family endonuclease
MATETRLYSVTDLQALPDEPVRYELVDGVLLPMNPPNFSHLLAELFLARLPCGAGCGGLYGA